MRTARSSFATSSSTPSSTPLRAELPGFRDADRVLLDRFRLRRRHDQHGDLAALPRFERAQLLIERRDLLLRQRAGEIGDRRAQRRDRDLRERARERDQQQQQTSARQTASPHRQSIVGACVSPELGASSARAAARRGRRCRSPQSAAGDRGFVLDREVRLRLVAEHLRGQVGGERAHRDVVGLHGSM